MSAKDLIRARLETIKPLEGIFPTASTTDTEQRQQWRGVAARVRSRKMITATEASRALLADELSAADVVEPAVAMFSGSREAREQVAGFAQAGIAFFHGSSAYGQMSLAERRSSGGNGSIARVMLEGTRILLEPERLVVRFETDVSEAERTRIFKKHGLSPIGADGLAPGTYRAACTTGFALDAALAIMHEAGVAFAEPDFIEHIAPRYTPADPLFARQWHHAVIASGPAWDITQGKGVRVAVIDNGFDRTHGDLHFGDLSGWYRQTVDFSDADFIPGSAAMPDADHGTACAGMIGAVEGNALGGCGVAFGADLSMIGCLTDQVGPQSTLARAIAYAADPALEGGNGKPGADIIVCSLGPNTSTWTIRQVLSDAIEHAATRGREGKGTAIFWACTNGNFPISADQVCSHPRVCAVGRSTSTDSDDGSGFGPELEFLAPGVKVLIPSSGNRHASTTGTSFAAPCAAGVAALALSQNLNLTADELRQVMRASCDKIGPLPYIDGRNPRFGYGRVNAEKAIAAAVAGIS